ncbi:PEP-CTERM sorting domain-containing protein [Paludisphaera borealis]|uniref:PEP-CTERM sorting domain-containing protein n=1 Tax=Paludisphaera borealis TaxID=1387353 RepID=A0A1U7CMT5_9BACT|nr:PEP-CTERM sorting domain-containing protein [Paludisphaera borealis]APW60264.1 PEP-CTERM sorting domain-containing protein [Paludisphaera borealis]
MDATQQTLQPRPTRWTPVVFVAVGLALSAADAQATPLRTFGAMRGSQELLQASAVVTPTLPNAWNLFLSTGPEVWATSQSPAFTIPVRRSIFQILNGDPASIAANPMIDYLIWRRDLNPLRFDRYHPYLGRLLAPLTLDPPTSVPVAPEVEPPITPLAPLETLPPSVPEPSSLLLIGLVSAWGLLRRRSRTTPAPK